MKDRDEDFKEVILTDICPFSLGVAIQDRRTGELVMDFISMAAKTCHVEVTTLVVPGLNDTEEEVKELSKWIASLDGGRGKDKVALHLSRYFPRFRMDAPATDVDLIYRLKDVASKELKFVFTGNC